tara:strand:+ start:639 stop:1280 length:642 start_codon:yes stop_codon:yes gene_type:complete
MRNLSLAAAMEAFVTRPELLDVNVKKRPEKTREKDKAGNDLPGRLDRVSQELSLYISIDPILGSLHKEYLDACALLDDLAVKNNPEYNAMTTVASDRVESAHSAFSARLIELRSDETTSAMVEMKRHRLILEEMEERKVARRMKEEKAYMHKKDVEATQDKKAKREKTFAIDMFMAYMMMSWTMHAQSRRQLKYAFEDAFIGQVSRQKTGSGG